MVGKWSLPAVAGTSCLLVIVSALITLGLSEGTLIIAGTYVLITAVMLTLYLAIGPSSISLASHVVLFYIIYAYIFKLSYIIAYPENVSALRYLSDQEMAVVLIDGLPKIAAALIPVIAVIFCFRRKHSLGGEYSRKESFGAFLLILVFSLLVKYVVHVILGWGVPGLEPKNVIPGVTGALTIYVRFPLLFLLNLFLVIQVLKRELAKIIISSALIVCYVVLDMYNGSKYSLVYQAFVTAGLCWYLSGYGYMKKRWLFIVAACIVVVLPLYKYINYLRFALLDGEQFLAAVNVAVMNVADKEVSLIGSLFNRVSGIEHSLFALASGLVGVDVTLSSLLNNELAGLYTENLTGVYGIVNAVGASQIAVITSMTDSYLIIAMVALVYFAFSFYVFRKVVEFAVPREMLENTVLRFTIELLLSIFLIYFIFGTGNLIFYLKEIFVLGFAIYVLKTVRLI